MSKYFKYCPITEKKMHVLHPELVGEENQSPEQTIADNNQHANTPILPNTDARRPDDSLLEKGQHQKCSDVNVANIDPVNPVLCLNAPVKHLDKLTNLACGSNLEKGTRSVDVGFEASSCGNILQSIDYVQSDKRLSSEKHVNKTSLQSIEKPKATFAYKLKWQCTLCKKRTITENQMTEHIDIAHNRKHRYQCSKCDFGDRLISTKNKLFHAKNNHPNEVSEVICLYTEIRDGMDNISIDTTPRNSNKEKNIRGIVIAEEPTSTRRIAADLLIPTQSMPDNSSQDTDEEFDSSPSKRRRVCRKSSTKMATVDQFESDDEYKPSLRMPSDTDEESDSSLSERRRDCRKSTRKLENVDQFDSDDEYKPSRMMLSDTVEELDSSQLERRRICRKSTANMADVDQFDSDDEY